MSAAEGVKLAASASVSFATETLDLVHTSEVEWESTVRECCQEVEPNVMGWEASEEDDESYQESEDHGEDKE